MTEENATASHLSVVMTTTGVPRIAVIASSPRDVEFYFHIAALVIGVLGTAANALVLYALVASKDTIRYDTGCSTAEISQLSVPHGTKH